MPSWAAGRIAVADGCWNWTGWLTEGGYGGCNRDGHNLAHRAVYSDVVGPIPAGLDLDHLCRNRQCVNPAHLEPVSRQENLRRSPLVGRAHAAKTHCAHGHERTPENTYTKADGRKQCRVCARAWSAGTRARAAGR